MFNHFIKDCFFLQFQSKPKSSEIEAKLLYDNIRQILETLSEFEFVLARQGPLPEAISTLDKQTTDFDLFSALIIDKSPYFTDVISKIKDFCSNPANDSSRLRSDLTNYSNEAAYRLKVIKNEVEKRSVSLETARIHLKNLISVLTKLEPWLAEARLTIENLQQVYRDTELHDLQTLEQFDKDAKTLEIILFSHKEDMPVMSQHFKSYLTSTDNFSKDLKNFCVKLKNNKINRLSADMTSDLTGLRQDTIDAEKTYETLVDELGTFKARLLERIDANMLFSNSCLKLQLWLNEVEPKLKNEIIKTCKAMEESSSSGCSNEGDINLNFKKILFKNILNFRNLLNFSLFFKVMFVSSTTLINESSSSNLKFRTNMQISML